MEIQTLFTLIMLLTICFRVQSDQSVIVAQDRSGNFTTITDAIQAAANNSNQKYFIHIKEGLYVENVHIGSEKKNIVLIGEGMEKTIISGRKSNRTGFDIWNSSTVYIQGDAFMAQGITFENTAGAEMQQAVALRVQAQESIFYQCRIKGYQDSLYVDMGSQFFRECELIGTIDFIFGDASVIFQNCLILVRLPLPGQYLTITAQGRKNEVDKGGIIFQNCSINATHDLSQQQSKFKCYLGRPWKNSSRTVFMQSFLNNLIDPKGWIEWQGQAPVHQDCAEYENRGPGANTSSRVGWSKVITNISEASQFTVRNFLKGNTWIPSSIPHFLDLL